MVRILKKDVRYNKAGHPRSSPRRFAAKFDTLDEILTDDRFHHSINKNQSIIMQKNF
jgi:hypothetical protein